MISRENEVRIILAALNGDQDSIHYIETYAESLQKVAQIGKEMAEKREQMKNDGP